MPYIGRGTSDDAIRSRFIYVASGSETSISGADANGAVLKFTDGAYVDVYLNGVLLKPTTDYNTNTANTIAGLAALSASDEVLIVVYDTFNIANTVDSFDGGTFQGKVTFENKIDMNGTELILDADADSSITADTDDQIDIRIAGADDFQFTANTFTALSGSSIATNTISETTSASGVTIDSVVLKDGTVDVNGTSDGIILDADGDTTISADTDDRIDFKTAGSDKVSILGGGTLCIGQTSARSTFDEDVTPRLQIEGDGTKATFPALGIGRYSDNAYGGGIYMTKTRGTSFDADTVVQDDDTLGFIYFQGTDGTDSVGAAMIKSEVDGTPGSNDMPGRLVFSTTADAAAAPTERMRIDSSGNAAIGSTAPNSRLRIQKDGTGNYSNITISNTNSTGAITFGVGGSGTGNYLANNAFLLNQGNSALIFGQNDTERMRINTDGNLAFPSGKGIDFSATANSADTCTSEVFDDYEEGNFVPYIYGDAGNLTLNSSYNTLYYTKIGRMVHIYGYLYTSAENSISGTLILSGLPFTSDSSVTNYSPIDIRVWGISSESGGRSKSSQVFCRINPNVTAGYIYDYSATGVPATAGNWLNVDSSTDILVSGTYMVA